MKELLPYAWDVFKLILIPLILWFFEKRSERRDKERDDEAEVRTRDQKRKDEMILRGLKTLSDCQYEVVYKMQFGHHNGGLEECLENVKEYRAEVGEWIMDRATQRR